MPGFVTYLRVSTAKQGQSGLGLEAQRAAVADYGMPLQEFVEVESGGNDDRPKLTEAIRLCRVYGAKLIVAKLDRLARDIHFLTGLEKSGLDFEAADMPNANRLTVHIMIAVAQEERRLISTRTKAALAAAKARGVALGGNRGGRGSDAGRLAATAAVKASASRRAVDICPFILEIEAAGTTSLAGIARALTERQVPKARGGSLAWSAQDVKNLKACCEAVAA